MFKNSLKSGILLLLMCTVTSLMACDTFDLKEYKIEATTELQDYAIETDYSMDNWILVCNAIEDGKKAIDLAKNKLAVDNAVIFAKTVIDNVEKDSEMEDILKQFDLSDPKLIWNGSVDEEFTDAIILLTLRKTSTYPELQLKHFGLSNAVSLEYVGGVRPPDYFFTEGYESALENYRQIVFIHIVPQGKEEVIKTIRVLEQLNFVRSASPNYIESFD